MDKSERLREAAEAGEIIKVIYNAGSQPGASREIAPISISNGKVRARCYASNAVKSFVIEKMEICNSVIEETSCNWDPTKTHSHQFTTLNEAYELNKVKLAELGWYVNIEEDFFSLHRRFKNGNPMKGADVSINYEEYAHDLVVDEDGEEHKENIRKRSRPWVVRAKQMQTATYGELDKAALLFLEQANKLAPINK